MAEKAKKKVERKKSTVSKKPKVESKSEAKTIPKEEKQEKPADVAVARQSSALLTSIRQRRIQRQTSPSGDEEAPKTEAPKAETPKEGEAKEPKTVLDCVKLARSGAKERKFTQSWDLCINLKAMDLKRPENRFNTDFLLPEGRGKDMKVAFFADSLASKAQAADVVIKKAEIDSLAKNKKKLKSIIKGHDWFFGEATLMVQIGKALGPVLAPRGKMPRPIPPKIDPNPLMMSAKKKVRVQVKETPVLQLPIGSDKMEDEKVAKNLEAVYNFVKEKLPKGKGNIRSVYVKLTMGPPVKVVLK